MRDEAGRFQKGGPPGPGRPKGSVNKNKVLSAVENALNGQDYIARMFALVVGKPKEELELLKDLLPYCFPKLQATEITPDDEGGENGDGASITPAEYLAELRERRKAGSA